MKIFKPRMITVRLSEQMRSNFIAKASAEPEHDTSSVLRALIELYLANRVTLPKPLEMENLK